jgi:hypothetical protein
VVADGRVRSRYRTPERVLRGQPWGLFRHLRVVYAAIWFGLSMAGHHAKTGKYIVAAVLVSIVFGAITSGLHYLIWRWRTARDQKASGASHQ